MTPLAPGFAARPFAHRALHGPGRPENGMAAIRAAVAGGWGIEIDLQTSADGTAMVFHDPTLDRLTGATGPVRAHPAADLGCIPLTGGDGEGIPTLSEVLAQVAGRVPLLIELKDQTPTPGGSDGVLEAATAAALSGYDGPVAVMSFNPAMIARMADLAPGVARGLVTFAWPDGAGGLDAATRDRLRAIADFDAVGAAFISHDHRDLDRAEVAALKARGVPVLCWTIRSAPEAAAALRTAEQITFEGYTPA
ncbi:glycerophosphodiester phosphodiesterase family protein [Rhodobaculum claviforme]|uniref:Phosphodiesterase n=1 Tax=Rhodobaculum claviforme TaxID=1549854 RepID=A0A934WI50_9RHOB|nr:glycerophosphodiester phosphodiesterase family protein [Rhodobaculum claviforme]MBK5926534.1 phosphodiesterase [Rhodobaculum claviforme]